MADPRPHLTLLILGLICAGLSVVPEAQALPQGRILGGEDAVQGEFPWSVSVRYLKAHACSGSLISDSYILTAAHCVSNVGTTPVSTSDVQVRVGSINQFAGGSIVSVKRILIHPSYGNFLHDIALIELNSPLTFSSTIAAVTLPTASEGEPEETEVEEEELPNGTPVYVAGWGELSDGSAGYKLQKANFNTLSAPYCELAAGYGYDSTVCLSRGENEGICRGDAGAGVLDDQKVLRAITSFYFGDCGSKYPDISTKVSYYLDWISANTAEE
ncbi:uncharacterized protein Dana_GF22292 [Drosophila ananassae]|uniref:trypsin n=1 Tax=Drosophila ananassae TaxID=7217 RepID=B3MWA4_DROAN|nr:trypsin delta [Drosophila ananassae]EDV35249.1 uncharacterized protein Dana_GF22292 [Drosophila ananassae]